MAEERHRWPDCTLSQVYLQKMSKGNRESNVYYRSDWLVGGLLARLGIAMARGIVWRRLSSGLERYLTFQNNLIV